MHTSTKSLLRNFSKSRKSDSIRKISQSPKNSQLRNISNEQRCRAILFSFSLYTQAALGSPTISHIVHQLDSYKSCQLEQDKQKFGGENQLDNVQHADGIQYTLSIGYQNSISSFVRSVSLYVCENLLVIWCIACKQTYFTTQKASSAAFNLCFVIKPAQRAKDPISVFFIPCQ